MAREHGLERPTTDDDAPDAPEPSDPPERPGADRLAELAGVQHEHLLPVAAGRCERPVADHLPGAVTLEELVQGRGPLDASEVAHVGCTVGRVLGALHAAGTVHGHVMGDHVLVTREGTVYVVPWVGPVAVGWAPADDVAALARLLTAALGGGSRRDAGSGQDADARAALRRVVGAGRAPDPERRPSAGTFAAWCDAAVPPSPIRVPDAAELAARALGGAASSEGPPPRATSFRARVSARPRDRDSPSPRRVLPGPSRSGLRRRPVALGATVASLVACAAAVVAVVVLHPDSSAPAVTPHDLAASSAVPAARPTVAPSDAAAVRGDPVGAARVLTARRVAALAGAVPDPGPSSSSAADAASATGTGTTVPGSPAQEAEHAQLAQMQRSGATVRGASVSVTDARLHPGAGPSPDGAVVDVVYQVGAHTQVSGGRSTLVPASGPAGATLVLEWTEVGWRVAEVS